MKTNSSQKNLANGLNGLSADKKVWTKPTIEIISNNRVKNGNFTSEHEGRYTNPSWVAAFAS